MMNKTLKNNILRAVIEVGFIMILFYSNLLMGEYIHSGPAFKRGFDWAFTNIFTLDNFVIAIIMACFAYVVVEYLRSKFYER
jgi:uncharacterized PurR-regulated membrane protein YhhQ (DUF165 family)